MISGGDLHRRATIMAPSASRDALGMRVDTWTDTGTVSVDVRDQGASEQQYADGVAVIRSYEVRCRWPDIARTGLTELHRLVYRGRTLKINAIRNSGERDRVAVMECTEVSA
jgi:head-tail adaptor